MKDSKNINNKWINLLLLIFVALLIASGAVWYNVLDFNSRTETVYGGDSRSGIIVGNDINAVKGERWKSEIPTSDSPDTPLTFDGETINCYIKNDFSYDIKKWSLRISPANECYLNGFWGGSVEVHQFRNGAEIIETLDQIMNRTDIQRIETNPFVDNMMIRILPGDYLVYFPVQDAGSDIIKSGEQAGIVFNFYYIDPLDFSDNELSYMNDVEIKETWVYPVMLITWIFWTAAMSVCHIVFLVNKRVVRDFKNSIQSISVMADLYLETWVIDTEKQTTDLIKGNPDGTLIDFEEGSIQESLDQYAYSDCRNTYLRDLKRFFNLSTLPERMDDELSIAFEYISNSAGYCSVRFFKLDPQKNSTGYILAVQDINEERQKLYEIEERIKQTEDTFMIQADFLETAFSAVNTLADEISDERNVLPESVADENLRGKIQSLNYRTEHLRYLENGIYDLFTIETKRFELNEEAYSIRELTESLKNILKPYYSGKDFEFIIDTDSDIPETLYGDRKRITLVILVLLHGAMMVTHKGFVKLSVYGKQTDNNAELVFSVKDTSGGFPEEHTAAIQEDLRSAVLKPLEYSALIYLQIVNRILRQMNSEMKMVSVAGEGSEFYFSLEQKNVNRQGAE